MPTLKKKRTFPRVYLWLAILGIGGSMLMVGCVLTYCILAVTGWSSGEYQQAEAIECKELASRHGIEVVTPKSEVSIWYPGGTIRAFTPDQKDLVPFAPALVEEFDIYPPEAIQRSKLKRIVLCNNLSMNTEPMAGVADYRRNLLFLDIGYYARDPEYTRQTMHHEFFHIIDFYDDGKLFSDPEWQALNKPDFKYGNGGWTATRDPETSVLTEKYPGFLNHYSTTGVEEDKAEMFSNMIKNSEYVQFRAMKDPVIQSKVSRMKVLLQNFCPTMDKAFWDRVEIRNREEP